MRIGLVSDARFAVEPGTGGIWTIYNFRISVEIVSFLNIPHSAFSTPARYIMEIFRRLCRGDRGQPSAKLIFNPLCEPDADVVLLVLAHLRENGYFDQAIVLADENNVPIAYFLPEHIGCDRSKFLSLLSSVDARLDQAWLGRALSVQTHLFNFPGVTINTVVANGFYGDAHRQIYAWVTSNALSVSDRKSRRVERNGGAERWVYDDIAFVAVMPCHAGDVLFLSLAFQCVNSHISGLVITDIYANIPGEVAPSLRIDTVSTRPINREGGNWGSDWEYFSQIRKELDDEVFYLYCRPSRGYDRTGDHIIDQFAFAIGAEIYAVSDKCTRQRKPPPLFVPSISTSTIRVLLHFDGGWPLKIYPQRAQYELIEHLLALGYQVTVLDGRHPVKCREEKFQDHEHFLSLLGSHHVLVGMDSYPCHYSAHVLGLPTICLFSSTQPSNSDARPSDYYCALSNGMSCCPCAAAEVCPLTGEKQCANFVQPHEVVDAVSTMVKKIYSS